MRYGILMLALAGCYMPPLEGEVEDAGVVDAGTEGVWHRPDNGDPGYFPCDAGDGVEVHCKS